MEAPRGPKPPGLPGGGGKNRSWPGVLGLLASSLLLSCGGPRGTPASPEDLAGFWSGHFNVWGTEVGVVLELSSGESGTLGARVHVPGQGLLGIPAGPVVLEGRELDVTFPTVGARYAGRLVPDGGSLKGDWIQSGARFRLPLVRALDFQGPPRPQEPSPPFPYRTDTVRFQNPDAGISLAGAITLPPGQGPFPAVVLVSGSGPQDRDETILAHRPFLVLADHLTRAGIGVLRYDDRGVGGSTGDFGTATSEDFASDALAGVSYLARHPEIDSLRIGIIGHSEGGIVGPMAAVRSDQVAFIVLLAPPGMRGRELIPLQTESILRASGVPDPILRLNRKLQTELLDWTLAAGEPDEAAGRLHRQLDELMGGLPRDALAALGVSAQIDRAIDEQMRRLASPWMRYFLTLDPLPILEQVSVPVLAVFGSKDLQVPPSPNLERVRGALEQSGHGDVTVLRLEGLNHLFQPAETGSPAEYGTIPETMDPEALVTITEWIRSRVGHDSAPLEMDRSR